MELAGKAPPHRETIDALADDGFDHVELYLTTTLLDEHDDIVDECRNAAANIATVHTPHIDLDTDTTAYYERADAIAAALDATLVIDSNPTSTRYTPDVYPGEGIDAPDWGYENDPSVSAFYLRNSHLGKGYPLVLDTAHLHMSEAEYLPFIESIIATHGADLVPVVHLDNATRTNDGMRELTDGTVDVERIVELLDAYDYGGTVVLEVPHDAQADALDTVTAVLDRTEGRSFSRKY